MNREAVDERDNEIVQNNVAELHINSRRVSPEPRKLLHYRLLDPYHVETTQPEGRVG